MQGEAALTSAAMSLLRTVLVWLAVLATPLQGFASATMLLCGPVHSQPAARAQAHDGHESHAPHRAAATALDAHAWPGEAGADADAVAGSGSGDAKCSLCAACNAAALPVVTVSVPVERPSGPVAVQLPPARAAFVTGGPERPPRSFLA
jgi:hypothetical protein